MQIWRRSVCALLGLVLFAAADVADAQTAAPGGYSETLSWYHDRSQAGDPRAQFLLAIKYETGTDVPKNLQKARELYVRAARQGHADAQFRAGTLAQANGGTEAQLKVAQDWYRAAALQGHVPAQYNLAVTLAMHAREEDQFTEAASWAIRAAEGGLKQARALQDGLLDRLPQPAADEARLSVVI
jgi:uncharacterized protein